MTAGAALCASDSHYSFVVAVITLSQPLCASDSRYYFVVAIIRFG